MRIGIDASNLRSGGGLTHLSALLSHADVVETGIERVIVWGPRATLERLPDRSWLAKYACPELDGPLAARVAWRSQALPKRARGECDLLFAPGGLCTTRFHPVVTMSRNMLPFQLREAFRYGPSAMLARLILLRQLQERSFRTADGVIFLSQFARDCVGRATGPIRGQTAVIPHGVDQRFFKRPRPQSEIGTYSPDRPLRLLYTSIVDVYKHQWRVADAVARLRDEGLPVAVEFVGNSYPKAERRLQAAMRRHDPEGRFIKFAGPVEHAALHERYHSADAFVFASSCENLPNILLEAMAAGLPIACSCRGPMREILGSGGLYFDPLSAHDMTAALRRLVTGAALRRRLAAESYARATHYSWAECARETFDFLARVLQNHPSRCRQRVANPR